MLLGICWEKRVISKPVSMMFSSLKCFCLIGILKKIILLLLRQQLILHSKGLFWISPIPHFFLKKITILLQSPQSHLLLQEEHLSPHKRNLQNYPFSLKFTHISILFRYSKKLPSSNGDFKPPNLSIIFLVYNRGYKPL